MGSFLNKVPESPKKSCIDVFNSKAVDVKEPASSVPSTIEPLLEVSEEEEEAHEEEKEEKKEAKCVPKTASVGIQVNLTKSKSSPNLVRKAEAAASSQKMVELVDLESVGNKRVPRANRDTSSATK